MSREKFLCKDENEIENIIQGWFSHRLFWSSMNLFYCHICVKWPKQIRIRSNYNKENGTHIQFILYFDLIKQYSNKAWTLQTYTALCKNAILTNFILRYQIDTKEGSRHGNDSLALSLTEVPIIVNSLISSKCLISAIPDIQPQWFFFFLFWIWSILLASTPKIDLFKIWILRIEYVKGWQKFMFM